VLGYERLLATGQGESAAAGELLLGELNCTSCHAASPALAGRIDRKPAPVLDAVGSRVRPEYLRAFLTDPAGTKPGTTMPDVLAALPAPERAAAVEALVHLLAATGPLEHASPMRQGVDRGERLFHSVGCVACHDPRGEGAQPLAISIPLGTPSKKYTLPGLSRFLSDPLAVRPGGRMPHLQLAAGEARDIASYLLNDLDVISGLQYAYYEGQWESLPDFRKLTPVAVGDAENFDLSPARRRDRFALRFDGLLQIEKPGEYLFLIGSDDGARLLIDDKVVVENNGVHPFQQRRKKLKLQPGLHSVVVEFFELAGEESLQVDFEGPGQTQQPLAMLLAARTPTAGASPSPAAFLLDPAKAARGQQYFAALGCAACHTLRLPAGPVQATNTAATLAKLQPAGGCLEGSLAKAPRYALTAAQQAALQAALREIKQPPEPLSAAEQVHRTLVRLNCYACHVRGGVGGVDAARDPLFQSDSPEMGDEGRLPPHLTAVGAKLKPDWLARVVAEGASDRPYMFTRMPRFGGTGTAGLAAALAAADADQVRPLPHAALPTGDEKRLKAAGRRLVGSQGFSCIKCHTFADKRSSGIQALSLTTMHQRLRPEWFHHYLKNPMEYRPGTRMPTPFPDGQSTLPTVLAGDVSAQIAAIWSYLADGERAIQPAGLVTGKLELVAFDEAVVYRNFIEGAGPRAIGVGYPEKLNLAFDASGLRLAMLWHGGFIDAARHWSARGAGFEGPLGDNILRLPEGPPFAKLSSRTSPWPEDNAKVQGYQFRGYRLVEKRRPVFLYAWNGLEIEDYPRPAGADDVFHIERTLTLRGAAPAERLWFRAVVAGQIEPASGGAFKIDNRWLLTVGSPGQPLVREQAGQQELLVPVVFQNGAARLEAKYEW
jgi:mono/diheme cytochrome c family protein